MLVKQDDLNRLGPAIYAQDTGVKGDEAACAILDDGRLGGYPASSGQRNDCLRRRRSASKASIRTYLVVVAHPTFS